VVLNIADVVKSGIGFLVFGSVLLAWALTFAYGGEELFGSSWEHLAVYDVADKYQQVRFNHHMCMVFTRPSRLWERCCHLLYSCGGQISPYMGHGSSVRFQHGRFVCSGDITLQVYVTSCNITFLEYLEDICQGGHM
jgi:hypothetical protein